MKVVTIGVDTSVTDVSEAVKCRTTDEDVVKVSKTKCWRNKLFRNKQNLSKTGTLRNNININAQEKASFLVVAFLCLIHKFIYLIILTIRNISSVLKRTYNVTS